MLRLVRYRPGDKCLWDTLVRSSVNGVFLHERDYMDYHASRFDDHSLVFFHHDRAVAVLPGHVRDGAYFSHEGLTFGGLITLDRTRTPLMLEIIAALLAYLRALGVVRLVYKAIPHIYHAIPADADLYALFENGAVLVRRDVASVIARDTRPPYRTLKRRSIARGRRQGLEVGPSDEFDAFMALVRDRLREKYQAAPTHTPQEMSALARAFPDNITLFVVRHQRELAAGAIVYDSRRVARTQYLASTEAGRRMGAVDVLIDHLLRDVYPDRHWMDFGTSMRDGGRCLNDSLLYSKEAFGARAILYDWYEVRV